MSATTGCRYCTMSLRLCNNSVARSSEPCCSRCSGGAAHRPDATAHETAADELAEAEAVARVIAAHGGAIFPDRMRALLAEYDERGRELERLRAELEGMRGRAREVLAEKPVHATDHAARGTARRILEERS